MIPLPSEFDSFLDHFTRTAERRQKRLQEKDAHIRALHEQINGMHATINYLKNMGKYACEDCGALVVNEKQHKNHHQVLNKIISRGILSS